MVYAIDEKTLPIAYEDVYREYGIVYEDGVSSLLIEHCPFCGQRLPSSLRDQWFEKLTGLSLEPEDSAVPPAMRSDAWWRGTSLET